MRKKTRCEPHIDYNPITDNLKYAALCYLNLPDECSGGTGFYRHRETNIHKFDRYVFDYYSDLLEMPFCYFSLFIVIYALS